MSSLSAYRKNIHSQNGEDGVLKEIFRRLEIRTGTFVEFGAWDGRHLSNTYHLLENGWSGVYIEGDADKFKVLEQNMEPFGSRIRTIHAYVEPSGTQTLDNLLAITHIGRSFEVLSIDIDSCDWQVWESLSNYSPMVVIIEINSSIPVGIYQTHRDANIQGSSFSSTVGLGAAKGYTPVCHTGNLIFVRNDAVHRLNLLPAELRFPELIFDYAWKQVSYEYQLPVYLIRLVQRVASILGAPIRWWSRLHR